jgi:general secretion pathway protein H
MRRCQQARGGFTLIEMLVALGLMGLIMSTAIVLVRPPPASLQLQSTTRKLCSAFRLARASAISSSTETTIEFDLLQPSYQVSSMPKTDMPVGLKISLTFAQSEQGRASAGRIRFFPTGSSTGGDVTLLLGGRQSAISVNWLTGVARCDL